MRHETAIRIVIDACERARRNRDGIACPLYKNFTICSGKTCNVPKFMAWLVGNVTDPADVSDVGLFPEHKTVPRGKGKK